jgi:hypothetical protein
MNAIDLSTVEALVRQHAPDIVPETNPSSRVFAQVAVGLFTCLFTTLGLAAAGMDDARAIFFLTSIAGIGSGLGAGWFVRRANDKDQRRFSNQLKDSPWLFYDAVSAKFSSEIERQRSRTIGPNSEWGRARLSLESAAQDAERSVAYWTKRLSSERDHALAQTQLATATRLRDKFYSALAGLDQRARLLVTFFNECEARIAVLQSTKRDYEEVRKLDVLADRSDEIVTHAEDTLASIGASFVAEALRVGNALGGLERAGLVNLAAAVPVEHLEALADRIVESSRRDQTALESVTTGI